MLDFLHLKETFLAILTSVLGYVGFKVRQDKLKQIKSEEHQNIRLDKIEEKLNKTVTKQQVIHTCTKNTNKELKEFKDDTHESLREVKADLKYLIKDIINKNK